MVYTIFICSTYWYIWTHISVWIHSHIVKMFTTSYIMIRGSSSKAMSTDMPARIGAFMVVQTGHAIGDRCTPIVWSTETIRAVLWSTVLLYGSNYCALYPRIALCTCIDREFMLVAGRVWYPMICIKIPMRDPSPLHQFNSAYHALYLYVRC